MKWKRKQLLIDRPVQLRLVRRQILHWLTFIATAVVLLPMFRAVVLVDATTPIDERFRQAGVDAAILFVVFIALLPYFIYNTIQTSNRFAGPIYRLRCLFRGAAEGESLKTLRLRDEDFWHDMADDYNRMVEHLVNSDDAGKSDEADLEETIGL